MYYVKQNGKYVKTAKEFAKVDGHWLPIVDTSLIERETQYRVFIVNDLHFRAGTDGNPDAPGAIQESNDRYYYSTPNNLRDFVSIVNQEKPDLVLALGDMCDTPEDFALFNQIWSQIDSSIRKEVTIGNHDFDDLDYNQLVNTLGYVGRQEVAGSVFNQSFQLDNNNRIIILDASYDPQDKHGDHWNNIRIHSNAVDWLENELRNSQEDNVFIGTHVAPHHIYFNATQSSQIKNMIDDVLSDKPKLNISWLFGHDHKLDFEVYSNLGLKNKAYLCPAMILNEKGRFSELQITKNNFNLINRDLKYQ